jgi:hypothetical protein
VFFLLLINLAVVSERLEYEIRYGPVTIGTMVLEQLPADSVFGMRYEHFRAEVEIDQNLSWLFWARYRFESWCYSEGLLTVRSCKKTVEKNYRSETEGIFDHEHKLVRYADGTSSPLADSARDLLSLWYFLRRFDWNERETVSVNAHIDRRNWRLKFQVTGRQKVKTRAGEFLCLVLSPGGDGPLGTVLVSDEPRRLPVLIRTRASGLTVTAFLRNIKISYE